MATVLRGYRKLEAIRDLAMDAMTRADIAEKYGVAEPTLYKFQRDFASEIDEVRANLLSNVQSDTSGLWITKKVNRLAEYERIADDCREILDIAFDDRVAKRLAETLKAVAEEMGSLPVRAPIQGDTNEVVYALVGVDIDKAFPQ